MDATCPLSVILEIEKMNIYFMNSINTGLLTQFDGGNLVLYHSGASDLTTAMSISMTTRFCG